MLQRIATFSMAVLGAASLSLAQDNSSLIPATSTPAYTPPPSSYSAPASTSSSTGAPRTGAYGAVMQANAASDNTVLDFTMRPTLIGNQQYITGWGGANLGSAAFSFQGSGFNWFGSILADVGPDPDLAGPLPAFDDVRLGFATSRYGVGLLLSMAKLDNDPPGVNGTRITLEGDGYGIFGDFNLGGSDVYGELALRTGFDLMDGGDPYVNPPAGATLSNNFFHILAGWKKDAATEGQHAINGELTINISSADFGGVGAQVLQILAAFNHGVILKQSQGLSVFVGTNTLIDFWDLNNDAPAPDFNYVTLSTRPNISFQKTLGKGFETFSGAGVNISFQKGSDVAVQGLAANEDVWSLFTTGGDVNLGLRWTYENFAVEGSVSEALLTAGPNVIGGQAPGLMTQAGISIGF